MLLSKYVRQELIGIGTKSNVKSRVSSREMVKKYVIAGRAESKLAATK